MSLLLTFLTEDPELRLLRRIITLIVCRSRYERILCNGLPSDLRARLEMLCTLSTLSETLERGNDCAASDARMRAAILLTDLYGGVTTIALNGRCRTDTIVLRLVCM